MSVQSFREKREASKGIKKILATPPENEYNLQKFYVVFPLGLFHIIFCYFCSKRINMNLKTVDSFSFKFNILQLNLILCKPTADSILEKGVLMQKQ